METLEKKKKIPVGRLAAWLVPIILIALFLVLAGSRAAANFCTAWFSRPVKNALGTVFGLLPFSVMELEYVAAGVFVLWFLARTVILTVRAAEHWKTLGRRVLTLALILLYVLTVFLWIFAIDYRADSFTEKSGLAVGAVEPEDLEAVTEYFLRRAAENAGNVNRDADGHWQEDLDGAIDASKHVYDNLSEEFPFLAMRSRTPKKMYLFSRLSSWMGFTGVFFPFSGESNINIDAPGCLIPDTIAHELAHQRGVTSELEANFLGIAACVSSGDPVFTYSGYLAGAIYLSNALYQVEAQRWGELSAFITWPMAVDWNDNNAYWAQFEGPVEKVSSQVYDGYLKAQGQELGIRSYGACVDLLVAYYIDEAHAYLAAHTAP